MSKPKLRRPRHTRVAEVVRVEVDENVYSQVTTLKFTLPWRRGESACAEVEIKLRPGAASRLLGGLREAQEKIIANLQAQLTHALGPKQ